MTGPGTSGGAGPAARRTHVFVDARKAADFGIGRYVTGLLRGLAALDRFELTALVRPSDAALLPSAVRPVLSGAPHYSVAELVSVRRAFALSGATILHAPHYVVPLAPPERTVVTIHDLMHLTRPEHGSAAKRLYARTMLGRAARSAARIICVSSAVALQLERAFPRSAGKVTVIPNGVDARFLAPVPAADVDRLRARLGLEGPFVLFLGNDKPHKNLEGLLRGFAAARRAGGAASKARLVLAGGAPERREVRAAAAAAAGLAGAVVDLGIVPDSDVPALIASATLLALPSFDEGFGLPVLEAQAVGTPAVCSNRGGLPEAAGGASLVVEPDPGALAEALELALGDESLRRSLAAKGLERVRSFTWDAVAERTAAVYAALVP